ncbi:hypothetical protein CIB84_013209 [Bambusicola thoracicus]|uniref:Uncharacterized protein n=1 Tax=Bambusicola thoracicus TaxID=9083 RepID=A0A2P4SFY9_BAMTH|nr:hypothetical protein CIB84_013209 [Bambusicola thoracicus]
MAIADPRTSLHDSPVLDPAPQTH